MNDPVNHPAHYTVHPSGLECIDVIQNLLTPIGNCVKYVWRHELKGSELEDLKKALWYLERQLNVHGSTISVNSRQEVLFKQVANAHGQIASKNKGINATIKLKHEALAKFYDALCRGKVYLAVFPLMEVIAPLEFQFKLEKVRAQQARVQESAHKQEFPNGIPVGTGMDTSTQTDGKTTDFAEDGRAVSDLGSAATLFGSDDPEKFDGGGAH